MRTKTKRSGLWGVMTVGLLVGLATPASAAAHQISGMSYFDAAGECGPPPAGYEDFTDFTMVVAGDLEGCWYTKVESGKDNGTPSGAYLETGREVFVGSLDGGPQGTFSTTYRFESTWAPEVSGGVEVHGRCQHPISGAAGGFAGATGRLDFKDDVSTGLYYYRGHIALG